jgi:transglutaminase-like putative cysteine protease
MLIRVEHATCYAYSELLVSSTQYVRMTPLSGPTQTVESWSLTCPGATTMPWHDQYGNLCHALTVSQPVEALEVKVAGLVRTRDTNGVVGRGTSELPRSIYLRETPYTQATPSIRDFALRFETMRKRDAIEMLHALMLAIAEEVTYAKGETHVQTTGAEALERKSGVCQDHAHIFCAAARVLGVPARYVSGYLSQGIGEASQAASHAWADAYVEDLGWVSFDPSNRVCATEWHVRTAVGLDYADACPIRGVRNGGGVETMSVKVSFPNQQQQQSQ